MAGQCFIVLALLGLSKRRMHVGTVEELSKEILFSSLHPAQVEQRIIFLSLLHCTSFAFFPRWSIWVKPKSDNDTRSCR